MENCSYFDEEGSGLELVQVSDVLKYLGTFVSKVFSNIKLLTPCNKDYGM